MDTSTVSYAVTGSLGNNNFVVDSSAGTFRTVDDDWTESGSYSLTVTATDGGGKTASRAFQFTVDTVMTGYYEVCDPIQGCVEEGGRSVFIEATRDGIFSAGFWNYDGADWDSSDSRYTPLPAMAHSALMASLSTDQPPVTANIHRHPTVIRTALPTIVKLIGSR